MKLYFFTGLGNLEDKVGTLEEDVKVGFEFAKEAEGRFDLFGTATKEDLAGMGSLVLTGICLGLIIP